MQRLASWGIQREALYQLHEAEGPVPIGALACAVGLELRDMRNAALELERDGYVRVARGAVTLTERGEHELMPFP